MFGRTFIKTRVQWCYRILCLILLVLAALMSVIFFTIGIITAILWNKGCDVLIEFSDDDDDHTWDEMIVAVADIVDTLRKAILEAKIEL